MTPFKHWTVKLMFGLEINLFSFPTKQKISKCRIKGHSKATLFPSTTGRTVKV